MSHVAIIACDHGLGHIRRCYLVAQELLSRGSTVDLYAPTAKIDRIRHVLGDAPGLTTFDFATKTTPHNLQNGSPDSLHWPQRLPKLEFYDHVLSDTLPEILQQRSDAIILAQFFWHDVLDDAPPSYVALCEALLRDNRPTIYGSDLFTMPAVRRQPRFTPVGLYGPGRSRPEMARNRDALLLSPGSTQQAQKAFERLVGMLPNPRTLPFDTVYVDAGVLPPNFPDWMRESDYTSEVYSSTLAAVCRPGLGVLTDALWYGATPICLTTDNDREMMHNAEVITRQGLGYHCHSLEQVIGVISSVGSSSSPLRRTRRLAVGDFTAAEWVAKRLLARPDHSQTG